MMMTQARGRSIVLVALVISLGLAIVGRWIDAARGCESANRDAEVMGNVVEVNRQGPATIFRLDMFGENVNDLNLGKGQALMWNGGSQDQIRLGMTLVVGFRLPPPEWRCEQCGISVSQIAFPDGHIETVNLFVSYGNETFEPFRPECVVPGFERRNAELVRKGWVLVTLVLAEGASLLILVVMFFRWILGQIRLR